MSVSHHAVMAELDSLQLAAGRVRLYSYLARFCWILVMMGILLAIYGLARTASLGDPWSFRFFLVTLLVFLTAALSLSMVARGHGAAPTGNLAP